MCDRHHKLFLAQSDNRPAVDTNHFSSIDHRAKICYPLIKPEYNMCESQNTLERLIMITDVYLKSRTVKLDKKTHNHLLAHFVPVLICLIHCYKKDLRAFQSSWGHNFANSHFRAYHCPAFKARPDRTLISGPEVLSNGPSGFRQQPMLHKHNLVCFIRGLQPITKTRSRRLSWRSFGAFTKSRSMLLRRCVRNLFRHFRFRIVNPIMQCLLQHCDDQDSVFIERWHKNYTPHTFQKRRCPRHCRKQAGPLPQ
jgi:hypothetical protein